MLFSFHYLVTAFFLAVWWRSFSWVMLTHFTFQTIWFLAGGSIPDPTLFWGYQALISLIGTVGGRWIGRRPLLTGLYSLLYFVFALGAYLAAQLLYAYYPPFSGLPAGQQGLGLTVTLVLSLVIIVATWYGVAREHRHHRLFGRWLGFTFLMQALFFIALTGWDERWVAISVGGGVALLVVISYLVRRKKHEHLRARSLVRRAVV